MSDINSVQSEEGYTITSNTQTKEQLEEQFSEPEEATGDDKGKPATPEASAQPPAAPTGEEKPAEGKNKWSRKSASARVEQAVIEKNREKARADEIEAKWKQSQAELERFRTAKPAESKPEPVKAPVDADPEPKEGDFGDVWEFNKALARWEARKEFKAQQTQAKEQQQRELMIQHQENTFKAFEGRVQEKVKAGQDYQITPQAMALIPNGPIDLSANLTNEQILGWHIVSEENGLDLLKHLSDNPTELQRLSTLPRGRLLLELGRMDGRLSVATSRDTAPTQTNISRASLPVRPVTAAPPSASDPDELPDPKLDPVAWGKKREALEERRRRA